MLLKSSNSVFTPRGNSMADEGLFYFLRWGFLTIRVRCHLLFLGYFCLVGFLYMRVLASFYLWVTLL